MGRLTVRVLLRGRVERELEDVSQSGAKVPLGRGAGRHGDLDSPRRLPREPDLLLTGRTIR
jgi:hypothetical protein